MNRVLVYLSALVGLGGVLVLAGQGTAQGPAPAATKSGGKVAVFNVMKVLKDYQKFQFFVKTMNDKRTAAMGPLSALRTTILKLQDDIPKEPIQAKRDEMTKTLVAKQREFEDQERQVTVGLDAESAQYLRQVYFDIQRCVEAIVQQQGCDIVFAYPDAVDPKEMENPLYFNAKLRSQAAMPFYVSPNADVTSILVATLNQHFPPPVAQAGAVAPATPTPPK